jgi:hypothetical protein
MRGYLIYLMILISPLHVNALEEESAALTSSNEVYTVNIDSKILSNADACYEEGVRFLETIRKGIIGRTRPENLERLNVIQEIVANEVNLRIVPEKVNHKLLTEDQGNQILSKSQRGATDLRERFSKTYRKNLDELTEYRLCSLVYDLERALNLYAIALKTIQSEEQLSGPVKINIEDESTPRGQELRGLMKTCLQRAIDIQRQLASDFPSYLKKTQASEEVTNDDTSDAIPFFTKTNPTLLFPYEDPQEETAKEGLIENYMKKDVSRAKGVILPKGQKVLLIQNAIIKSNDQEFSVSFVKVTSEKMIDLKTKKLLPPLTLQGWIISDFLEMK